MRLGHRRRRSTNRVATVLAEPPTIHALRATVSTEHHRLESRLSSGNQWERDIRKDEEGGRRGAKRERESERAHANERARKRASERAMKRM